jgi:hypothetical protein
MSSNNIEENNLENKLTFSLGIAHKIAAPRKRIPTRKMGKYHHV